jgi:adenine-specific DNA-methyltransferase
MKYMGSKRTLLQNGLGALILEEAGRVRRIVDLFCGAGSVVRFAAVNTDRPVLAVDLQEYAVVLARSILGRVTPIDPVKMEVKWIKKADVARKRSRLWRKSRKLNASIHKKDIRSYVMRCRGLCEESSEIGPVWNAYGGHYFSPEQALTFDYLLKHLPDKTIERNVCRAAIIITAMQCVASPGHTAQPFQPTRTAGRFIIESWRRDPIVVCYKVLKEVCQQYAQTLGEAHTGDAIGEARNLRPSDLVIIDPPYTGVHYSRFYHVLETIARGSCGPVSGTGRYPAMDERPQSRFSNSGQSKNALETLFLALSRSKSTIILTFPEGKCSNGLSGDIVYDRAKEHFNYVNKRVIPNRFSTLGGNKKRRDSRKDTKELLLLMR